LVTYFTQSRSLLKGWRLQPVIAGNASARTVPDAADAQQQ